MRSIKKYRKSIDKIDRKIILLIKKRIKTSRKIGDYKRKNKLKIYDVKREKEKFGSIKEISKKLKLDSSSILKIFKEIISYSRKVQN